MNQAQKEWRIIERLPETLEFIADLMEQKTWSFITALDMTCTRYDHDLARALNVAKRAICLGMTLEDALRHMSRKADVPELTAIAEAIIHADQTGADIAALLRDEAHRIRTQMGA